jgi:hypothetical protein
MMHGLLNIKEIKGVHRSVNLTIATRNIGVSTSEFTTVFYILLLTSAAGIPNCCD